MTTSDAAARPDGVPVHGRNRRGATGFAASDPPRAGRLPHQGHGWPRERGRRCGPRTAGSSTCTARATSWPATSTGRGRRRRSLGAERVGDERGKQRQRGLTVLRVITEGTSGSRTCWSGSTDELGVGKATPDHILFVTPGGGGTALSRGRAGGARRRTPRRTPASPATSGPAPRCSSPSWTPAGGRRAAPTPPPRGCAGVDGDPETIDLADIHPYAGHGTFIAGVVRTQAPCREDPRGGLPADRWCGLRVRHRRPARRGPRAEPRHHLAVGRLPDARRVAADGLRGLLGAAAAPPEGHRPGGGGGQRRAPAAVLAGGVPVGGLGRVPSTGPAVAPTTPTSAAGSTSTRSAPALVNAYPTGTFYCHEPPNVGPGAPLQGHRPVERHVVRNAAGRRPHRRPDERARDQRPRRPPTSCSPRPRAREPARASGPVLEPLP